MDASSWPAMSTSLFCEPGIEEGSSETRREGDGRLGGFDEAEVGLGELEGVGLEHRKYIGGSCDCAQMVCSIQSKDWLKRL